MTKEEILLKIKEVTNDQKYCGRLGFKEGFIKIKELVKSYEDKQND